MAISATEWLRDAFTANLNLKIISFAFALVLYSMVHGTQDVQRPIRVPLVSQPPPKNGPVLITKLPTEVRVTVRGPRALVDDLDAQKIGTVQIDLSKGKRTRVAFEPASVPIPPGIEVEQIEPAGLDLVWEDRVVRDVPVQVSVVGTPAAGFVVKGLPVSEPPTVRAEGPKSEIVVLQHGRAEPFDVSGLTEGKYTRQLAVDRPELFDTRSITATIEIAREVAERFFTRVPIAVIGPPKAKAQPAEVDVRLTCPPEIVRALRAELIVPRAHTSTTGEHGSEVVNIEMNVERCEVYPTPSSVVVRW